MHVETRTRERSLLDGLQDFLRRRTGRRGAACNECLLEVELPNRSRLVVSDADPYFYGAISRAARRADQPIARRLGRRNDRSGLPHPV